jgi:hypothetical protein
MGSNTRKKRRLKLGVVKFFYNLLLFINIVFILGLIGYYGYRTKHYYDIEHPKNPNQVKKLASVITNESNIVYSKDGLYTEGKDYRFIGRKVKNYVSYSGLLWRIIKVNENGNIILISDDSQTPLVWGYDSKDYSDSYVNKWLNKINKEEDTGIFYNALSNPDKYLDYTDVCIDSYKKVKKSKCKKIYKKSKIGLISIYDYLKAGGTKSYLNNNSYFWTSNMGVDNKVWYVFNHGGLSDKSNEFNDYYSYGVRPVITLKDNVSYVKGTGTKTDPYIIENYNYETLKDTKISQYIKYSNYNWKVIGNDENGIKVVMDGVITSAYGDITRSFNTYVTKNATKFKTNLYSNIGYYLNTTFYRTLREPEYLNRVTVKQRYYSLENSFNYQTTSNEFINCYVSMPNIGDLYLDDVDNYYTMTIGESDQDTMVSINDKMIQYSPVRERLNIRPVIYLRNDISIQSGNGTKNSPFIID